MTDADISRRTFLLSAATATALPAGKTRARAVDPGPAVTDRYAFLLDHIDSDARIPTLARFADADGAAVLADLGVDHRTHPQEAVAHARLTPEAALTVAEADRTELLEYAPGANPFWKVDAHGDRVFPAPEDSVDYIAFEEAVAGLERLEAAHGDRLRVERIGSGHGHRNRETDRPDPRDVWVAHLTDDVGTAAAPDRETVVFEMGIHGDERAGVEAGLRFLEDVLTGERPAVAGLLSEVRLLFVSLNPDGWVVREPVYENPVDPPDFRRFNGADHDLNRHNPTAGRIPPDRLPAEPRGANLRDGTPAGTEGDVPERVAAELPEALALVDTLRSYDVVSLVDFHGMYGHTEAVLALEPGGGTPRDRADAELLGRTIRTHLEATVGDIADWRGAFEAAVDDTGDQVGCGPDLFCQQPDALFARGTTLDTIDYTVSGGLSDWAALPEQLGGLDATALTLEVVFSNSVPDGMEKRFLPELVRFQVEAYGAVCRAAADHATEDVGVAVETGGRSTAYLATDALTRRASDLPHVDGTGGDSVVERGWPGGATSQSAFAGGRRSSAGDAGGRTTGNRDGGGGDDTPAGRTTAHGAATTGGPDSTLTVDRHRLDAGTADTTVAVPAETHTLAVEVRAGNAADVTLRDGNGNAVERAGTHPGDCFDRGTVVALDPEAGEWTVEVRVRDGPAPVEVRTTMLVDDGIPDPMDALGYGQRDYEVTPLTALAQLDGVADGPVDPVAPAAVADGALLADDSPAYDNLVVLDGDLDAATREAVRAYVGAGGNLVVTDSGVELLADLDLAGLAAVDGTDIVRTELDAAAYPDIDPDHPLVAGRRTRHEDSWVDQREPWTHPQLGYARGEVPMYAVDEAALEVAGASVASAGETGARLATVPTDGDRVGVHLLGSLLPPANQENLHPFGLVDHSLTMLGTALLCNALGYRLALSRDGDRVVTLGALVGPADGAGDDSAGDADDSGDGTDSGGDDGDSGDNGDDSDGGIDDRDGADGADDDGPGFGVAAGLAGAGGLGYLLSRHLPREREG